MTIGGPVRRQGSQVRGGHCSGADVWACWGCQPVPTCLPSRQWCKRRAAIRPVRGWPLWSQAVVAGVAKQDSLDSPVNWPSPRGNLTPGGQAFA